MFSIVIPLYNEAKNIEILLTEIYVSLKKYKNFEIILVNDFSSDNNWSLNDNWHIDNGSLISRQSNETFYSNNNILFQHIHVILDV